MPEVLANASFFRNFIVISPENHQRIKNWLADLETGWLAEYAAEEGRGKLQRQEILHLTLQPVMDTDFLHDVKLSF